MVFAESKVKMPRKANHLPVLARRQDGACGGLTGLKEVHYYQPEYVYFNSTA